MLTEAPVMLPNQINFCSIFACTCCYLMCSLYHRAVTEAKNEVMERKRDLDATKEKMDKLVEKLYLGRSVNPFPKASNLVCTICINALICEERTRDIVGGQGLYSWSLGQMQVCHPSKCGLGITQNIILPAK